MIRKFAFVILNNSDQIADRYNLDLVDGLSGLGFQLEVNKISTDVEDYITKIVQKKQNVGLTVHHRGGYTAGSLLKLWLSKHISDCLCIEYTNNLKTSYIQGTVIECGETEINEYGILEQKIVFQPLTPFFEKYDNDVRIEYSAKGKSYPLAYPYSYGQVVTENNEITNTYIHDIPLTITLYGSISAPDIQLKDESGETYNEVSFPDIDLRDDEKLIINASQKKIIFVNENGEEFDYFQYVDGAKDAYLRAKPLETSTIHINIGTSDTGRLIGSRRQYRL